MQNHRNLQNAGFMLSPSGTFPLNQVAAWFNERTVHFKNTMIVGFTY
jgi:hypothetical protein